jgi:hypothetical protein
MTAFSIESLHRRRSPGFAGHCRCWLQARLSAWRKNEALRRQIDSLREKDPALLRDIGIDPESLLRGELRLLHETAALKD